MITLCLCLPFRALASWGVLVALMLLTANHAIGQVNFANAQDTANTKPVKIAIIGDTEKNLPQFYIVDTENREIKNLKNMPSQKYYVRLNNVLYGLDKENKLKIIKVVTTIPTQEINGIVNTKEGAFQINWKAWSGIQFYSPATLRKIFKSEEKGQK